MTEVEKNVGTILRCPHCGSSDVAFDENTGKLKCSYCRSMLDLELVNDDEDIAHLKGKIVGKGAEKIIDDKAMVTIKCTSCGSKITINTDEALSARCPWCRHILSIQDKLPNGAVPDMILPFKVTRNRAFEAMRGYIDRHKMFGKKEFIAQFSKENLMGVFLPYMVVDMNVGAEMSGEGEHLVRRYTVGSGDNKRTYYDADAYHVHRKFDLIVDDLTIEASSDKLNQDVLINSNNIVNSIMPFDTKNAVAWDARLVRGYACEKRDIDTGDVDRRVKLQTEDIMRYQMLDSISFYNRGVRWDKMRLEQKGVKWKTAYMPVWLYNYFDRKSNGQVILHYIAVNGRTGEMLGSTPLDTNKAALLIAGVPCVCLFIVFVSLIITSIAEPTPLLTQIFASLQTTLMPFMFMWLVATGIIVGVTSMDYRHKSARHMHEKETFARIDNLEIDDAYTESRRGLSNSQLANRSDNKLSGIQIRNGGLMLANKRITGSGPKYKAVKQSVVMPTAEQKKASNGNNKTALVVIIIVMISMVLPMFVSVIGALLVLLFR